MKDLRKAHTEQELTNLFNQRGISKVHHKTFIDFYKICYQELAESYKDYTDEDFKEESLQESTLNVTDLYIEDYLIAVSQGHGDLWAHHYGYNENDQSGEDLVSYTYGLIYKLNPELAKKELLIHAKALNEDEIFINYYIKLFELLGGEYEPAEKASKYYKLYKEQIGLGKTEIYAHKYANLLAHGYDKEHCEIYASVYEKTINEGKSIEYALEYAEQHASALLEIEIRFGVSDDIDLIDSAMERVADYMKQWEMGIHKPDFAFLPIREELRYT